MAATIKKISELCGVSRGTVDRVLNNRPGVKPEIREKVLSIASQLNYVPNAAAKALAYQKKPVCFGVIMPPKSIPFFEEVCHGIHSAFIELKDLGVCFKEYHVSNSTPEDAVIAIKSLAEDQVSGILISSMNDPSIQNAIDDATNQGIPFITFNSDINNCKRLSYVGQDLYKSGQVAAGLMMRVVQSTANIIVITGNIKFQAHKARVDGFTTRMSELNKDINIIEIIESYDDRDFTYEYLSQALNKHKKVSGIYMAAGHIGACAEVIKEYGLSKDIRVICNDIIPEVVTNMNNGIIDFTIDQDPFMQGYKPVKLLYDYVFFGRKPDEYNFTGIAIKIPESL